MIKAKTPLVNKPESKEEVKFFTAENDIIPIRPVTHEMIMQLTEIKDEVIVNEEKVDTLVKQYKSTNQFNKFFTRVELYVDKLEKFLKDLKAGYFKLTVQKKVLLESEKSDQLLKTYRAKREVNKILDEEKKSKRKSLNLDASNTELLGLLAAALGIKAVESVGEMFGGTEIYSDVVSQGEFTVDRTGAQTERMPAWIPFPKGTQGLVFTSGFGYQPRRGYEHGGIDIGGPVGTPIITPISGIVTQAGWNDGGYGYWTIVKSGSTEMTFGHLYQSPPVRAGQQVQAGTVIGGIGSTGRSTGPHLHWTITIDGVKVDPALWTQSNRPGTATAGARTDMNRRPNEPSSHPSMGDFDGRVRNNESEGAFMTTKRIMVGEADPEFVIPMSQMPLFIQGMLEEKIRSLNPYYDMSTVSGNILPLSSGNADQKYSSGAIIQAVNIIEHHEALSSFTSGENDFIKKGFTSVGSSKTKWSYVKSNSNKNIIFPYQNPRDVPTIGWGSTYYFDNKSRKVTMGDGPISLNRADKLLKLYVEKEMMTYYPTLFKHWNKFTDSQKASLLSLGYNMGKYWVLGTKFLNLMQQGKIAEAARQIPNDIPDRRKEERKMLLSGPQIILGSKIVGERKVGSGIPFIPPFMYRPPQKKASLNEIDGSMQMEVASAVSNEMDYSNDIIDITYLYKPIVKVPVDLA